MSPSIKSVLFVSVYFAVMVLTFTSTLHIWGE